MNWSRRNNAPRRRLVWFSLLVLALLCVDLLSGGAARTTVQKGALYARGSVAGAAAAVAGSGFFSSRNSLARENAELRATLAAAQEERALCLAQAPEREVLEKLAHLAEQSGGISVRVISTPGVSPYGTFHIDAGSSRGIGKGDEVLSAEGFLIGEVFSVSDTESTVAEVFAPGARGIVSLSGAHVEALGMGKGNARIDVPRGVAVEEGNIVFSTTHARPVALVGRTVSDASSATTHVYARSPVSMDGLSYVYVVTR